MENNKIFGDGIIAKKPSEKAPDFIKLNLAFKVEDFTKFLAEHSKNGWVNLDVKESKGGKTYTELNVWEKDTTPQPKQSDPTDDLPF